MRKYINDSWYFRPDFKAEYLNSVDIQEFEKVRIPHTVKEIPLNYVNNQDYQMVSTYYTELDLRNYSGKLCYLVFEGNAHYSEVYLNGKLAKTHACGYTSFSVPLQDAAADGKVKVIVKLDSRETLNQPPFGNVVDYLTYGGIYRDTYLDIKSESFLQDVFVKAPMDKSLTLEMTWHHVKNNQNVRIQIAGIEQILDVQDSYHFQDLPVSLWDVDNPNLYTLTVELLENGEVLDIYQVPVGFR